MRRPSILTFLGLLWIGIFFAQAQPTFTISTIAGNGIAGFSGDGGQAVNAMFRGPFGVAPDAGGNLYIADFNNQRVRKIATDGTITTTAGTGQQGFGGDGGPATKALLSRPSRISIDGHGNLFLTDPGNNRVRKVAPDGTITTVAGNGNAAETGDGGLATNAALNYPASAVADAAGNLYISDNNGNVVRKVDTNGIITTVAGNGVQGYSGDGGAATKASLNVPVGIAVAPNGDLFIADENNNRIRKVSNGVITTFAGTGAAGFSGDGGMATSARLSAPSGPFLDAQGDLYFADTSNSRIRVVFANGTIGTIAGSGPAAFGGDGGPALSAELNLPLALAVAPSGAVYIADSFNQRIRLLTPTLQAPSITTGGVLSATAFGGFTSVSPGSWIEIYGSNFASGTRGWGGADFNGFNAPTSLDGTKVTIGGQAAFVDFISPTQVNALIPSNVPLGLQQITVTNPVGISTPFTITVNAFQPGLLAPSSFLIGGIQYALALFADGTYVLPTAAIPGINSRPAKPGETIVLYGVGFGPVIPTIPAGQLVQQSNTLASGFQMSIAGVPAMTSYTGLAPNYTGLYQFNVMVPSVAPGTAPLTFTLGSASGTQNLSIAVGN